MVGGVPHFAPSDVPPLGQNTDTVFTEFTLPRDDLELRLSGQRVRVDADDHDPAAEAPQQRRAIGTGRFAPQGIDDLR